MQKILVIGASKGIGEEVVKTALARDLSVRAFARSADKMTISDPNFEAVAGDATKPEDVDPALDGVDGVIMALGVPKNLSFIVKPTTVFSDATRAILPGMQARGIKRLLVVTGYGAGDGEQALSSFEKLPFKAIFGRAYADKGVQEDLIKASDLDWTIARPGVLTYNHASHDYKILTEPKDWRNGLISRADVADFLVTSFVDGSYIHQTPVLVR
ncbi:NAD(P)-dependent oxidoreductase [Tropicimonas sp. S265A]|uniref:NAD(P)-dependent oxidoreductase n=1 Tax=Tropicimonas sp. S265A TaxID=3415134 RepID=UPI003C7C46B5